jgi:hypothetical protein
MTQAPTRGRKKKRNAGWFRRGHDPRRHCLTNEERSRGGKTTFQKFMLETPWMLRWLQKRIDATSKKGKANGATKVQS